jgi:hypothetical protein
MGLATVPWDRRQTDEAGGLGVVETSELGRLDHEHMLVKISRRRRVRPRNVEALAQVRVCVAQCLEASGANDVYKTAERRY